MISAALQRRVWMGNKLDALYPNMYCIPVGDPGVGKGRVIKQVESILKHHPYVPLNKKLKQAPEKKPLILQNRVERNIPAGVNVVKPQAFQNAANVAAELSGEKPKEAITEKVLALPVGANATSYEALVSNLSKNRRPAHYYKTNGKGEKELVIETHASMCFCLEEVSSLFRKSMESLVDFLITAWDCGDYKYETRTHGAENIYRCCLSLFGGTTPSFMRRVFSDDLLTDGFAARTLFIFEPSNRFDVVFPPEFTSEQLLFREEIVTHVGKLIELNGEVNPSPEAREYLEDWNKNIRPHFRPNNSLKLNGYYARKHVHWHKMAMAFHFGQADFDGMIISKETYEKALVYLEEIERRMHYAINIEGQNPLAKPSRNILAYLKANGPQTFPQLIIEFFSDVREAELKEILQHLKSTGSVETLQVEDPVRKKVVVVYKYLTDYKER